LDSIAADHFLQHSIENGRGRLDVVRPVRELLKVNGRWMGKSWRKVAFHFDQVVEMPVFTEMVEIFVSYAPNAHIPIRFGREVCSRLLSIFGTNRDAF
jgi:hypothetical protein